jgi:hypothetical protein
MDENAPHRPIRLDEFTESVEQLWQEEAQIHEARDRRREGSSASDHVLRDA